MYPKMPSRLPSAICMLALFLIPALASGQTTNDWRQAMNAGKSVAISGTDNSTDAEITDFQLSYPFDPVSGHHNPVLIIRLKNISDHPLLGAELGTRLYIPGQEKPVVDSESSDSLHVFFHDQPLLPQTSRTLKADIEMPHSGWWITPDILNAGKRQLILKINHTESANSPRHRRHPVVSFSELGVHSGLDTVSHTRRPENVEQISAAQLKDAFQQGKNVALNNNNLQISDIHMTWQKDQHGHPYPDIRVTARNLSAQTISSARFHAHLYQPGKSAPLLDTASRPMVHGPLYGFFGEYGLKSGETRQIPLRLVNRSDLRRWQQPALGDKDTLQLVLRVDRLANGAEQKLPGQSQSFSLLTSD